MLIAYLTFSVLTFLIVLYAFLKDQYAPKTELTTWIFILITAAIWPITLPFIVSSKVRAAALKNASTARAVQPICSAQTRKG